MQQPHFPDEVFERELTIGHRWQRHVANFLVLQGLEVACSPLRIRPDYDARKLYSDGDLIVGGSTLVEVKSRRVPFTSAADIPAKHLPFFVDEVPNYLKKRQRPEAYVIVSTITGAMVSIAGADPTRWQVVRKQDTIRGCACRWFAAPASCIRPVERLVQHLQNIARRAAA